MRAFLEDCVNPGLIFDTLLCGAKGWVKLSLLSQKRLKEIVQCEKMTHAQIAARAGTSRTRITAILNDDLEHVSADLLIHILGALGYKVKVSVTRAETAA